MVSNRLRAAVAALILLLPGAGYAAPLTCAQAAAAAELAEGIPASLLLAIGVVESGRADGVGGRAPWPWSINANGVGRVFQSAEDAVAAVRQLRASGIQSIDIGCFQVNVFYHPDAFADLESGFDPATNARAAAQFLNALHGELGSWERAVAAYHSRVEALGGPYREQVFSAWLNKLANMPDAAPAVTVGWYRRPGAMRPGIQVWGPAGSLNAVRVMAQAGLPRIITPSYVR